MKILYKEKEKSLSNDLKFKTINDQVRNAHLRTSF